MSLTTAMILKDIGRALLFYEPPDETLFIFGLCFLLFLPPIVCIKEFSIFKPFLRGEIAEIRESSGQPNYITDFGVKVIRYMRGWTSEESWKNWISHIRRSRIVVLLTFYLYSEIIVLLPSVGFGFLFLFSLMQEFGFYTYIFMYFLYKIEFGRNLKLEDLLKPLFVRKELFSIHPLLFIALALFMASNYDIVNPMDSLSMLIMLIYLILYNFYLEASFLREEKFKLFAFISTILLIASLFSSSAYLPVLFSIAGIASIIFTKVGIKYNKYIYLLDLLCAFSFLLSLSYKYFGINLVLLEILLVASGTLFELGLKVTYTLFAPSLIPISAVFMLIKSRIVFLLLSILAIIFNAIFIYSIIKRIPQITLRTHIKLHRSGGEDR